MEGQLEDYQTHFHTGAVMGDDILSIFEAGLPPTGSPLKVLDLGCGDGLLSERIKQRVPSADVVGVDADPAFVKAAVARGVDARLGDGHSLSDFPDASFDRVFSNAALHWMSRDPYAVAAAVFRTLKPGGRFVNESGGKGNVATVVAALSAALGAQGVDASDRNPWFFPSPEEYGDLLRCAGFEVLRCELVDRPTELPCDVAEWLRTFSGAWLKGLDDAVVQQVLANARTALAASQGGLAGCWTLDYVRLRVEAKKPAT